MVFDIMFFVPVFFFLSSYITYDEGLSIRTIFNMLDTICSIHDDVNTVETEKEENRGISKRKQSYMKICALNNTVLLSEYNFYSIMLL
uniref:Putative secreted protein n=1 Tax=Xenopsylla cheopis TaxID=163159 RepID=A0A6M2DZN6_XENCH